MRYSTFVLLLCYLTLASTVQAQNLVVDPGFEQAVPTFHYASNYPDQADFGDSAWTTTSGIAVAYYSVGYAHSGQKSAYLLNSMEAIPDSSAIAQTLNTIPGRTYELSFYTDNTFNYTGNGITFDGPLTVTFGDQPVTPTPIVISFTGSGGAAYRQYIFSHLLAASSSTKLEFSVFALPNEEHLTFFDDISVTLEPATVPEADGVALLVSAATSIFVFLLRHRAITFLRERTMV